MLTLDCDQNSRMHNSTSISLPLLIQLYLLVPISKNTTNYHWRVIWGLSYLSTGGIIHPLRFRLLHIIPAAWVLKVWGLAIIWGRHWGQWRASPDPQTNPTFSSSFKHLTLPRSVQLRCHLGIQTCLVLNQIFCSLHRQPISSALWPDYLFECTDASWSFLACGIFSRQASSGNLVEAPWLSWRNRMSLVQLLFNLRFDAALFSFLIQRLTGRHFFKQGCQFKAVDSSFSLPCAV